MREQNWTNKWRQRGAGYTCQSMSRSPFSLLHLHWLCLFDHPQLPSPILLYLFVLCVPKRVINRLKGWEQRERERKGKGEELGEVMGDGRFGKTDLNPSYKDSVFLCRFHPFLWFPLVPLFPLSSPSLLQFLQP